MITASLYYYKTETSLSLPTEEAALMQSGDIVTVSFMLPDNRPLLDALESLANGENVTLYRNTHTLWVEFRVTRREFFFVNHTERGVKTLTVHVEPVTWKGHEAVKLVQSVKEAATHV